MHSAVLGGAGGAAGAPKPMSFFTPAAVASTPAFGGEIDAEVSESSYGAVLRGNEGSDDESLASIPEDSALSFSGPNLVIGNGVSPLPEGGDDGMAVPQQQQWAGFRAQAEQQPYAQWAGAEVPVAVNPDEISGDPSTLSPEYSDPQDGSHRQWGGTNQWPSYGDGFESSASVTAMAGADIGGESFQGLMPSGDAQSLGWGVDGSYGESEQNVGQSYEGNGPEVGAGYSEDPWNCQSALQGVEEELTEIDF